MQDELDNVSESSKTLEDEFEADEDGNKYRNDVKNADKQITKKVRQQHDHCGFCVFQESSGMRA